MVQPLHYLFIAPGLLKYLVVMLTFDVNAFLDLNELSRNCTDLKNISDIQAISRLLNS